MYRTPCETKEVGGPGKAHWFSAWGTVAALMLTWAGRERCLQCPGALHFRKKQTYRYSSRLPKHRELVQASRIRQARCHLRVQARYRTTSVFIAQSSSDIRCLTNPCAIPCGQAARVWH